MRTNHAVIPFLVAAACSSSGLPVGPSPPGLSVGVDSGVTSTLDGAATDAGVCSPQSLDRKPRWVPPRPWHQDACTPAQATAFLEACAKDSDPACKKFEAENPACFACAHSTDQDSERGPIIYFENGSYTETNFYGCIALAQNDLSISACGANSAIYDDCAHIACRSCLPITSTARYRQFVDCFQQKETDAICANELAKFKQRCSGIGARRVLHRP